MRAEAAGLFVGLAVLAACSSGPDGTPELSMAGVTPAGAPETVGFLTETTRPSALATERPIEVLPAPIRPTRTMLRARGRGGGSAARSAAT